MANIYNNLKGFLGLFSPVNKSDGEDGSTQPTADVESINLLSSKTPDKEIVEITRRWEMDYLKYEKDILRKGEEAFNYWLGKQYDTSTAITVNSRPLRDNLIFEALETFLPIATRTNPEAVVECKASEEYASLLADMLDITADELKMKLWIKEMTRHWSLYYLGAIKFGWDFENNCIKMETVNPRFLILDRNARILPGGMYSGKRLGIRKKNNLDTLKKMFPDKTEILSKTYGSMAKEAKINYREWWTPTELFYTTTDGIVLGKYLNPHFNYDGEVKADEITGEKVTQYIKGYNHFRSPRMPFVFLSVFNLGTQPHDNTSLIEQNLPIQDLINKRYKQIDRNIDMQNNAMALSGDHFTKEQASQAAEQLARGNPLWVPEGDITRAFMKVPVQSIGADVFNNLFDARNELRNIFGTSGSTPSSVREDDTVRGKIMTKELDSSRIGGGITEYIEEACDSMFNWIIQLMMVHYDEQQFVDLLGEEKAQEFLMLREQFKDSKIKVTIKPGSLIPKDPMTKRNEAMELWGAGAIDPITLFERLDWADPEETAYKAFIWRTNPMMLFQEQMQQQQMAMPAPMGAEVPIEGEVPPEIAMSERLIEEQPIV